MEAALFRGRDRVTLILQNAADDVRTLEIDAGLKLGIPAHVEQLAVPELMDRTLRVAHVEAVAPARDIPVPAYSVTRVVWQVR